jgi:hypothetical protein
VQAKYRNDLEAGSEEFTHMRCRCKWDLSGYIQLIICRHCRHMRS